MSSNYARVGNPNNNYKLSVDQPQVSTTESPFSMYNRSREDQFHPYKALQAAINKELMK